LEKDYEFFSYFWHIYSEKSLQIRMFLSFYKGGEAVVLICFLVSGCGFILVFELLPLFLA
jgi:hypothetical protein